MLRSLSILGFFKITLSTGPFSARPIFVGPFSARPIFVGPFSARPNFVGPVSVLGVGAWDFRLRSKVIVPV